MTPRLSLVGALTPEQLAERDLNMIASASTESLELKLLKSMFLKMSALEATIEKLLHQPRQEPDKLVGSRYIMERFGLATTAANALMYKIGVRRVGENGGRLKCYLGDVDRYERDPEHYEQRERAA